MKKQRLYSMEVNKPFRLNGQETMPGVRIEVEGLTACILKEFNLARLIYGSNTNRVK